MYLDKQEKGAGDEVQLTDAIQHLNTIQRVFAYDFEGARYDVGEKLGFIKTTIEIALEREDLKDDVMELITELVESNEKVKS